MPQLTSRLTLALPALLVALLALLAGCSSVPRAPTAPSADAAPVEAPRPGQAPPQVLAGEVQWMKSLFEGTPVAVVAETDGAMRIDVPMEFAFDDKSVALKAPLRAVMDRVAATMARQASAKVHVASPGPAARSRESAMRSYFNGRGVIGIRVVMLTSAPSEVVTMRIVPGPVAIDRLDDQALPSPTKAFPGARAASRPGI